MRLSADRLIFLFAALIGAAFPTMVSAAEMQAKLSHDQIYLGTSTSLVVEIQQAGNTDWPKVEHTEGLDIRQYRRPRTIRNLVSGQIPRQYQFLITPKKKGSFKIPAVYLKTEQGKLQKGPFKLAVLEAELKFVGLQIDPTQVMPGEFAELVLQYQGYYPNSIPTIPPVKNLTIRPKDEPEARLDRNSGIPFMLYKYRVSASIKGTYRIKGIQLNGVAADPVTLDVTPYVIEGIRTKNSSVVLGEQTRAYVFIRGLSDDANVQLIAPKGLRIEKADEHYRGQSGATVFAFILKPQEPGSFSIKKLRLPSEEIVDLPEPLVISARRAGKGGILSCSGEPRKQKVVIGEPIILDCKVFFRGDLQAAGVDLSEANFAGKDYIQVEPVNDLAYPDWQGTPLQASFNGGPITMLSGAGLFNNQKEQMLRFALRITPLASGKLDLEGITVILRLQIRKEQQTGGMYSAVILPKNYIKTVDSPPVTVIDPPGITAPAGYRGAVGSSFHFSTSVDRRRATAMSPVTLTMRIKGATVTTDLIPPPLENVEELTRQFELSSTVNGGEVRDNTITFTQVIRPRNAEVIKIPALPFVFYDYKSEEYKTVYSLPIPIEVFPGRVVGAEGMETNASATQAVTARDSDSETGNGSRQLPLPANYTKLGEIQQSQPFSVIAMLAILLAGPLTIGLVGGGLIMYRRLRPSSEIRKRRRALIRSVGQTGEAANPYAELANLLQEYLRLRFDLPTGELSNDMLEDVLPQDHNQTLAEEVNQLLDELNAGRFTTGTVDVQEKQDLVRKTENLMNQLERKGK